MKRGTLHALCDSSSFSEIKEYSLKTPDSGPHGLASDREGNIWFTANFKAYIGKLDPRSGNDVLDQELQGGKAMLKQMMFKQFAWLLCCVPLLEMALVTRGGDKPIRGSSPGNRNQESSANATSANSADKEQTFRVWGVRYQVRDVDRSVTFYTQHLGFELEQRSGSAFASVSNGGLTVLLSGPGSSGSRPMPDGRRQEPGGWNRIVLRVDDLTSLVATMKKVGLHFRNEIETGPGGKQIQVEDPDGNAIELFEPAS